MFISFKTLWFGTPFGASFPGGMPFFFAVICSGIAVLGAVLCGVEHCVLTFCAGVLPHKEQVAA